MPVASIEDIKAILEKPIRVAKFAFTPLALVFLILAGWHSRDILTIVFGQAISGYLLLAILVWMFSHILSPILSLIVFSATNPTITYSVALSTHVGRLPARYLPGGIWHTVARMADFHSFGVTRKQLAVYVILENVIAVGVACTIGGTIVTWYQDTGIWHAVSLLATAGGVLGLTVCPIIINRWVTDKQTPLSLGAYAQAVGVAVVFWTVASMAFIFYLSAFPGSTHTNSMLEIAGTYLFSWGVGYMAIFAPQGLGVFEVVASDVLQTPLSMGALTVLIAGFRVIVLMADLAAWGILLLARPLWPSTTERSTSNKRDDR